MESRRTRWLDVAGLCLLAALVFAVQARQSARAPIAPDGDYACHLMHSAAFHRLVTSDTPLAFRVGAALTWIGRYPFGAYTWSSLCYMVMGASARSGLYTQFLLFIPLLVGTFLLCRHVCGRVPAWAATLLVASSPNVLFNSRQYMLDMPMAAVVPLALYFLLASEAFARRGYALLLGASMAAGMLCKYSFGFFLFAPWLAAVVHASVLEARERGWLRVAMHWLLAINLGALSVRFGQICYAYEWQAGSDLAASYLARGALLRPLLQWTGCCVLYAIIVTVLHRLIVARPKDGAGQTLESAAAPLDCRFSGKLPSRLLNAQYSLVLWLVLLTPWYDANLRYLQQIWTPVQNLNPIDPSVERWRHLPFMLDMQSALWWGPIAIGLVAWLHPRLRAGFPVALAFGAATYMMVAHLITTSRYIPPFVPLAAVLAVYWTARVRPLRILCLGLAVLTAGTILGTHWGALTLGPGDWRTDALMRMSAFVLSDEGPAPQDPATLILERVRQAGGGGAHTVAVLAVAPGRDEGVVPLWMNLEAEALFAHPDVLFVAGTVDRGGFHVFHLHDTCPLVHELTTDPALLQRLPPFYSAQPAHWRPDFVVITWQRGETRDPMRQMMQTVLGPGLRYLDTFRRGEFDTVELWRR